MLVEIEETLSKLTERHQAALLWFVDHTGQKLSWPESLSDGTLLACKPKGIYKPKWTKYALSVRHSLGGPYSDRDPELRSDGTWSYNYFQENSDPDQRDSKFTNLGLVQCIDDVVPVGVFLQVAKRPSASYLVLGLAVVVGWDAGYFHLEGFSTGGVAYGRRAHAEIDALIERHENAVSGDGDDYDGREHAIASIVRRRGQLEFRKALMEAYEGKCAISGCDAVVALEACHIRPYRGPQTNTLSNGLLLRADLHTLFDLGLLAVDTQSMTAIIAPEPEGTSYSELAGKVVAVPKVMQGGSNIEALNWHRRWAGPPGEGKLQ